MVYVTFKNNKFDFYPVIVTWEVNGEKQEVATDAPSEYEKMVNNNARLTNFSFRSFTPTKEQQDRLNLVNEIQGLEDKEGFSGQVNDFVIQGYIDSSFPEFLTTPFLKQYETTAKQVLVDQYKAELALIRFNTEIRGVEFMGKIIKSDRESQSTITSTVVLFNTGAIDKLDFKCANDEWLYDLTKDQFLKLALTVSGFVNACFKAETLTIDKLAELPLETIRKKNDQMNSEAEGEKPFDITELYNTVLAEVLKSLNASLNGGNNTTAPATNK